MGPSTTGGETVIDDVQSAFLEAEIALRAPHEGGRRSAIRSGYRCSCRLNRDDHHVYHDASISLHEIEELSPGSTGFARVYPHHPDDWRGVVAGSTVELCEGPRVVGRAVVTATSWQS